MTIFPRTRRAFGFVILICLAVSAFCVAYPMYVIRPFRTQGARELAVALEVVLFRQWVTVLSVLAAAAALAWCWRSFSGKWRRALAAASVALLAVLAALARVNVYELMFHPLGRPSFAAARSVKLDPDEKVIAVKIGAGARAYPIRIIAYHHIVNDLVEGHGIVATY